MPFFFVRPPCLGRLLIPLAVLAAAPVHAAQYFLVGAMGPDSRCQYTSIQAALNAAAANGPGLDYVMVANNAAYTGQALQVGAQSVLIEGGYANCDLDLDDMQPFADLVGNANDPVIRIEPFVSGNQDVRLSNLRIRGGGRDSANGGGLRVQTSTNAHVQLSIERTEITGNRAQSGGGVHVQRSGNPAGNIVMTLHPGTRIHANTAASNGGGLNLWGGNAFIAADGVRIDDNVAAGGGGGIATLSDTYIAVGNPDIDRYPGRTDVTGARIENNRAGTNGGGILLSGNGTTLEAREIIVDGNSAGFGGGGMAITDGAVLSMMRDSLNAFGWYCPPARECTRISNNQVGDAMATGNNGGALALYGAATAHLNQTLIRDNRAQDGSAIFISGAGVLRTEGVEFSGNRSYDSPSQSGAVIRARYVEPSPSPDLRVTFSTFVDNQRRRTDNSLMPAVDIIGIQGTRLLVVSSAFFDAGVTMYSEWGGDCLVGGLTAQFASNGIIPRRTYTDRPYERIFLGPSRRDWRPRFDSPLTDVCDTLNATPAFRDRDLQMRCRDEVKPDRWGTCDAGEWENDQIFAADMGP